MKHDWHTIDGEIDIFRYETDGHNGPGCMRCQESFCHHCYPERMDEECNGDEYLY